MRRTLLSLLLFATACASTGRREAPADVDLPTGDGLRATLTGPFHGYWTGSASGTILSARDGALLRIPIVLDADLTADVHWKMDATDMGELILEKAGHYNSSVWFVATQIEVEGRHIYVTKFEENYEDTLCLELIGKDRDGAWRLQARSFLADPGEGERVECLRGDVPYDSILLLLPGPGEGPEFIESSGDGVDRFGAEPPDGYFEGAPPDEGSEESDEL